MESFETRIVKTWKPSVFLRILLIALLMGGGIVVYVLDLQESWINTTAGIAYFVGMFGVVLLILTYNFI